MIPSPQEMRVLIEQYRDQNTPAARKAEIEKILNIG